VPRRTIVILTSNYWGRYGSSVLKTSQRDLKNAVDALRDRPQRWRMPLRSAGLFRLGDVLPAAEGRCLAFLIALLLVELLLQASDLVLQQSDLRTQGVVVALSLATTRAIQQG
jgi:hypothetical protein